MKIAVHLALFLVFSIFCVNVQAQINKSAWSAIDESSLSARGIERQLSPEKYKVYRLDRDEMADQLALTPLENSGSARKGGMIIAFPDPTGKIVRFRVEEAPLLSPAIAAKFPTWKTYQGYGVDEPTATARFDVTDSGFHGYAWTLNGTFSIDPYAVNDQDHYLVFYVKDKSAQRYHCDVDGMLTEEKLLKNSIDTSYLLTPEFTHGSQIRTYRLGIATTAQFTTIFRQAGDTDAQAQTRAFDKVVVTVNRVTGVYRRDFAVSFTLVSGTNLIYAVSPETPADYANTGSSDLNANVTNMNAALGADGYDVGHVFGSSDNGVAQLSSVCGSSKARGYSGQPNPAGDGFDIDYVAHEMGHQFGANHTFTATADCNTAPANSQKEPGAAVTIMGYAGICAGNSNPQRHSIDTFHVHSLTEMISFVTSGAGATCGVASGTNTPPAITPLSNFTIPFNTPFTLSASATDADGNPLSYNWEQNDAAASPSNYPGTTDDDDISLVFRPGFRSYLPLPTGSRTFPSLPYILNFANEAPIFYSGISPVGADCADSPGGSCITGEDLPSAARTMNFRVTVRDGQGGVADAGTVLTVINTSIPFKVTAPNAATVWNAGSSKTVTWDVAGTTAGGIDTPNVKISLSADGGQTFPFTLAASTPNDGSQTITAPAVDSAQARIKVEAIGNIFFDINDVNFTTTSAPATNGILAGRITKNGRGVANIRIEMTSTSGTLVTTTSSFGYFSFDALPYGLAYTVTPTPKKGMTFNPVNIVVNHNTENFSVNFTGQ